MLTSPSRGGYWLARFLHPGAWWLWALGLATAASRTTNPLTLLLIVVVVCFVVASRRSDAPWALAFRLYLWLAAMIVVIRVFYRVLLGGAQGATVLISLPTIPLPDWAAGITLLGPVTAESLLAGAYDGLRLGTMIICVGTANALANPKRLLKSVPGALYEVGTAVVVALSVFPQLAESVQRVSKARKLRGSRAGGRHAIREIIVPVLADALDRSLSLAAAMDSRGYGRQAGVSKRSRYASGTMMIVGILAICVGVYGMLDAYTPRVLGLPMLIVGVAVSVAAFTLSGRRVKRSRYRPDPWRLAETLTALSGIVAGASLFVSERLDPLNLNPSLSPLEWPAPSMIATVGVLVAALPAWVTPRPPSSAPSLEEAVQSGVAA